MHVSAIIAHSAEVAAQLEAIKLAPHAGGTATGWRNASLTLPPSHPGKAARAARLREAAQIYLRLGRVRDYCELMMELQVREASSGARACADSLGRNGSAPCAWHPVCPWSTGSSCAIATQRTYCSSSQSTPSLCSSQSTHRIGCAVFPLVARHSCRCS